MTTTSTLTFFHDDYTYTIEAELSREDYKEEQHSWTEYDIESVSNVCRDGEDIDFVESDIIDLANDCDYDIEY